MNYSFIMRISQLGLLAVLSSSPLFLQQAQAAPATTPVIAEPLPEKDGLRVSIASHHSTYRGDNVIGLGTTDPYLLVVLQNTSDKPIFLFEETNESGNGNLTLEIRKVDDLSLDKPIVVQRAFADWYANGHSTEQVDAGGAVVRNVELFVPDSVMKYSTVPVSQSSNRGANTLYDYFPFPNSSAPIHVTMRAVFSSYSVPNGKGGTLAWAGRIASPWKDYLISW